MLQHSHSDVIVLKSLKLVLILTMFISITTTMSVYRPAIKSTHFLKDAIEITKIRCPDLEINLDLQIN